MNVRELIELLDDYDPEAPVLIAHQPSWPLAEVVAGVVEDDPDRYLEDRDSDPDEDQPDTDEDGARAVWIVAGGHPYERSPYAPKWIFDAVEVGR